MRKANLENPTNDRGVGARNVCDFQDLGQDVIIKTTVHGVRNKQVGGGPRGKITEFSTASMKRLKLHLRNVPPGYTHFLTLTYPRTWTNDGKEVKYHWQKMRQWLQNHGCTDGTMFFEFQKRGAPHLHAVLKGHPWLTASLIASHWCKIIGESLDSDCFRVHSGRVKGGKPCWEPIRKPHAISYYATKYATKPEQKEVPDAYQNVGRFWSVWGSLRPVIKYFWWVGVDCVQSARVLMMQWRLQWKKANDKKLYDDDFKLRYSGTLWGGSEHLDALIDDFGYVPF